MKDKELMGKNADMNEEPFGTVHDFYLDKGKPEIPGIIVSRGLFKSKPVQRGFFRFDGRRYLIDPKVGDSSWKPSKRDAVRYSDVRGREVFAGPGWKIGRLQSLDIDTEDWRVASLDVNVEHHLVMRDTTSYQKLPEEKGVYGFKHFYKDAYSFRPGKIVAEMKDSDKARFLTDSGDSTIRGLGEAISRVTFPPQGMRIDDSRTITLPINANEVERIVVNKVKEGALKTEAGRKNIVHDVFREYYEGLHT